MRKQIAQQTILALTAWLLFLNFNIATTPEHLPKAGKGIEYLCGPTPDPSPQREGRREITPLNEFCAKFLRKACATTPLPLGGGAAYQIKTIVLDAGHGGKDPGCIGASSKEKDHCLAIVLKLGALLKQEYPNLNVIYTRETDVFVDLYERAAIANRNNADLFISVHCNSISVSHVKGTETYVMGLHTAESNLQVAKRENASIFLEDNYKKNYGGYDPNSDEAHIFGSVWQSAYLEQSILFASYVQQYAKSLAKREDRGVKQAGFIVLHQTAMPSVLVEAGFLTNRGEEQFIVSEEGQAQLAQAIFEAFKAYKTQMEGGTAPESKLVAKGNAPQAVQVNEKKPATAQANRPTQTQTPATAKPVSAQTERPVSDIYADEIPLPVYSTKTSGNYRIYLMSWKSRLDKNTGRLGLLSDVEEEFTGGEYHYYIGRFASQADAEKMLSELANLGFRTAKIVQTKPAK